MRHVNEEKAREVVDKLAKESKPEDIGKVDAQFHRKLAQLDKDGKAPKSMLEQLRTFWAMLQAPDEVVPFRAKALIMGAVTYFVSPFDMVPDLIGFAGHIDDAIVVRIVYGRVSEEIAAFEAWKK